MLFTQHGLFLSIFLWPIVKQKYDNNYFTILKLNNKLNYG